MYRILLVDDDESFRKTVHKVLERAGYEVDDATDGKYVLEAYRRKPCDLILTDLIMPQKEGLETIMEVRRFNPRLKIIAMSGGGRSGPKGYLELVMGNNSGMDAETRGHLEIAGGA